MSTNRLAKSEKPVRKGSIFCAAEWARMAEERGLHATAKLWWKADREGWDDENYDYVAAQAYKQRIAEKRGGR